MAVRMDKAWVELNESNIQKIASHLGVYQLGNATGEIVYIGVADGRSRFGLKGELLDRLSNPPAAATCFRTEVNMAYRTRHTELLQVYVHDHKRLPVANTDVDIKSLGRLRPAGG